MRRLLALTIASLFAGIALAGCATDNGDTDTGGTTPAGGTTPTGTTPTGGTTPTTTTPGGTTAPNPTTYTIMTIGEPESLDPAYDYETAGGQIISNVYETLYTYDGESAIDLVPALASEMPTISDDGLEYTIPLRQNVEFHDGTAFTAEDVKFSLDRIIIHNDPHSPAFIYYSIAGAETYGHLDPTTEVSQADRDAYLNANGVQVVDDHTVKITLEYADPAFLYKLAFQAASIVSKDAFCENAPANAGEDCFAPVGETRHEWADTHAVGTNDFKLERWNAGQEVVLVRNDDYWGPAPAMERVFVKKVDDYNTRLLALRNGDADEVYIPVDHDTDVMNKEGEGIEVIENPSWTVGFIGFNQAFCGGPSASGFSDCMTQNSDAAPRGSDGTVDPLFFSDIHMRKAWAYAFDYDTYINEIVGGHGQLLNGVLPAGIFGYDASIESPRQDLELARQELAASNHPDGFSATIYFNTGNTVREQTANLLAQNLEELGDGINVGVEGLDWSTAFLPKQRAFALPVFYLGWAPDYAFPDNYAVPFAHSTLGTFAKRMGYANPQVDTLLDELVRTTDQDRLEEGYSEVVQMINDDFAFIWLAQGSSFHVQRDWVEGYYYNPMHSGSPNSGDFSALRKA